jgi:hypothetical protein
VSATNKPYQAASDGAYPSVPETIGLKNINCINEDAHDLSYDSDGEIGPFSILLLVRRHLRIMMKKLYVSWKVFHLFHLSKPKRMHPLHLNSQKLLEG